MRSMTKAVISLLSIVVLSVAVTGQVKISTPKEHFGFNLGDDYQLANYKQIADYWRKLDAQSERLVVQEIGKTAEGRPQLMAIVTSPQNHKRLARLREISRRMALAEGLTDEQARLIAREGRAVVWIDGGLHATETLGAQQLTQMIFEMVSRTDDETLRFLEDCVILFVHANPDGNDLVADWYMRTADPTERTLSGLPRLYQKYIGHDNNRDFFASTQVETENINRVLYHDWFPQILYNHHQSGPAGTVVWSSPQRDPYNYNLDPLLILGLQAVGTHLHQRLATEGKPGATMASGGAYDGWWNGGIRNTGNFHNIIAILTETIGSPTPMRIPFVAQRQLPNRDQPFPIAPQEWKFWQSVDYSLSFNRAVLDYASRNRELLLFNIYKMGQRAIQRGNEDTWTASPSRLKEGVTWEDLRKPELRDPRAYIIPADQPDFPTAVKFINALREVNVTVHRATADFSVGEKKYPVGSFVVFTAQAFRPHVLDMFEPQDHPNVIPYPGGAPTPPYDNAGWTLAFQMGVKFDRILEPLTGPFERVAVWNVRPPQGRVGILADATGYTLNRVTNDAFRAVNRLMLLGEQVSTAGADFLLAPTTATITRLQKVAAELGVSFQPVKVDFATAPPRLSPSRIGLWDQYGGSMPSGWTRWILEQFEFPFSRVFARELDAGSLNGKYDVLIFVDGAIPSATAPSGAGRGGGGGQSGQRRELTEADVPAEYHEHLGRITVEKTIPQLRAFAEAGGTIVAIGSSAANIAAHFKLPVDNHLVEDGKPLPRSKYFVPGSVLTARVDTKHPAAAGMNERTDFFFDNSPVFRITGQGVRPIASFDTDAPLHSGWAWGQKYLNKGVIAAEATVGRGRVLLYGPEILHRAQPHGTFKLLFNVLFPAALP